MTLPGVLAAGVALARALRAGERTRRACHRRCGSSSWRRSAPPALYLVRGLVVPELRAAGALRARPRARCCCRWPRPRCRPRDARAGFAPQPPPPRSRSRSSSGWSRRSGAIAIWAGAESMGAVTRLDGEDRELARYLRAHRRPARAGDDRAARVRRDRHRPRGRRSLDGVDHADRDARAARDGRGEHAGDGRALPRRLRPRGRKAGRAACPTGRGQTAASPIRPLARRQIGDCKALPSVANSLAHVGCARSETSKKVHFTVAQKRRAK